jgi:DNA-binding NtrC family response regulator
MPQTQERDDGTPRLPLALIVDDDPDFAHSLELLVKRENFETRAAGSLAETRGLVAECSPDVILLDMGLPDGDGMEFVRNECASIGAEVIVITGQASVDSAVEALREGVLDYLVKPVDRPRLKATLANVARTRALKSEVGELRGELRELGRFGPMVGRSRAMQAVYDLIERVAPTDAHVFITGESGTGKELVAQTIHQLSARKSGPMLPINCGAVSPQLIESELFGHERGSFTGAEKRRVGYFEEAMGGTLFLDEITEMGAELQVKLLRVLEDRTLRRVGGTQELKVDVRLISATNRDPREAIQDGKLREDLYYRLNVFPLALPTLAERRDDIPILAEHFRKLIEEQERSGISGWEPKALELLGSYTWPGNVRELRNVVHRAYVMTEGRTIKPDVVESLLPHAASRPAAGSAAARKKAPPKREKAAAARRR